MKFEKSVLSRLLIIWCALVLFLSYIYMKNIFAEGTYFIYLCCVVGISFLILFVNRYDLISAPIISLACFWFVILAGPLVMSLLHFDYVEYQLNIFLLSLILFYVGYYLIGAGLKKNQRTSIEVREPNSSLVTMAVIIYSLGTIAMLIYLMKNRAYLFSGNLSEGRVESLSGNGIYIYMGKLMYLGTFICLEEFLKSEKYKSIVIGMSFIAVILSLLSGYRSNAVDFLLVALIMWNRKKPIKQEILIGLVAILIVAFMGYAAIRNASGSNALAELYSELRVGSVNFNSIIKGFPSKVDFQYGYTYLMNLIMLLPGSQQDFTLWLKDVLNYSFSGGGVTPTILGEFYINWGYFGLYSGITLLGFFYKKVQSDYDKGDCIFIPALFMGYIRSIFRGGVANSMIILIIYIVGYYLCKYASKRIKIVV